MNEGLKVFWYDPDGNILSNMNTATENGYLVFETTHFSVYVLAQLDPSANVSNPETGDNSHPVIPLALLGAGSALGLLIMKKRIKFKSVS